LSESRQASRWIPRIRRMHRLDKARQQGTPHYLGL
jgi:hypothetical protein